MARHATTPLRVILDTNVWSRLAEADAGLDLRLAARAAGARIVAAPSVLYELARMPDPASRSSAVRLITEPCWHRLMPEAYLEAEEIISLVGRYRPHWIIERPALLERRRLSYDWSRRNQPAKRRLRSPSKAGVWERFRHAPDKAARELAALDGGLLDAARSQARDAREEMRIQDARAPGPLRSVMATFAGPRPGWDQEPFELWRGETAESLWLSLFVLRTGGYLDWIAPVVDLQRIAREPASWLRLWIYEVSAEEAPRQWLRWAFTYLQRFRRPSPGSPCDVQLSAYLTDADVVLSGDKQFIELVEAARAEAPAAVACGARVVAQAGEAGKILEAIRLLGEARSCDLSGSGRPS